MFLVEVMAESDDGRKIMIVYSKVNEFSGGGSSILTRFFHLCYTTVDPPFHIPRFNQLQIKNNRKKYPENSKRQNLNLPVLTTIYITFILFLY